MYKKDVQVDISKYINNLKILPSGYVYYFTKSEYDPSLKYTVDNRKAIGKLVDKDKKTFMYPNDNYYKFFSDKTTLVEPNKKDTQLHVGSYFALIEASKKFGCLEALKESFPKDYQKILALAIFSIECCDSTAQHYDKWSFSNYSGIDYSLSSGQISELYQRITESDIRNFLEMYQKNYRAAFPQINKTAIAYDSTNQNTTSNNTLAEYGHAKEDKTLPIINTVLLVDETTGIPLYYDHFNGSLLDKVQVTFTNEALRDLGFNKLFYMLDRGYYSKNNVKDLEKDTFGMMLPSHIDAVKTLLEQYKKDIKDNEKYYIRSEAIYGIKTSLDVFNDKTFYDVYVYYDSIRASEERNSIHSKIDFYIEKLNNIPYYSNKLEKTYGKYFKFTKTKPEAKKSSFTFTVKEDEIQKDIDLAGIFCVLSNGNISAEEMIVIARARDRGEKGFKRLKSGLNLTTTYSHFDSTYKGKMFIAFIALVLCETYRYHIIKYLKATSSNTTFTSLAELSKIIIYKNSNNKYSQKYALTKNIKDILIGLDLDQKSLTKFISEINSSIK